MADTDKEESQLNVERERLEREKTEEKLAEERSIQRLLADAITHQAPLDDIKLILRHDGQADGVVNRGLRPLHYAAFSNYIDCVKLLLDRGCDINARDDVGYTPIHLCARRGHYECMKLLIGRGAQVNFRSEQDPIEDLTIEPLNIALENNRVKCARLLLQNGAEPNRRYFMGHEVNLVPLENIECLDLLLKYDANPDAFNRCGLTPLMKACKEQEIIAVRLLLQHGANINIQCPPRFDQKTALHFAIQRGNVAISRTLLLNGADPSRPENYKYSALHAAIQRDKVELCHLILKFSVDVNELTDDGCTPLMLACASCLLKNQKKIVELLLKEGANPNSHADVINYIAPSLSPLVEYLRNNETLDYDIVYLLIIYGARVNFSGGACVFRKKDPFGILFFMPQLRQYPEILRLLEKAAGVFDAAAIARSSSLTEEEKQRYTQISLQPLPVKHLIRLMLRNFLRPKLPEKIKRLPMPPVLKKYLLFEI